MDDDLFHPEKIERMVNYFVNNPNQPYCAYVVAPKVDKLRKHHADKLK